MSQKVRWLITDENISVNYNGETHIVKRSDALADRLIKAVKENKLGEIPNLVSAAKRIEAYSKGKFLVQNGKVLVNGVEAPSVLSDRIVKFSSEGLPYEPLVKFAENLQSNPSFRAVTELFQFLEKNNHPLTENGNFIAYKKVRADFKDAYTGTMDNSVGQVVSMSRNQVNEDPTQTCSHGLHVANWDYAHNVYSAGNDSVMLEVEVNPADVVAVPVDYNQAKMRVCKYKVLGVVTQPYDDSVSLRVTDPSYSPEEEEEEEEEEEKDICNACGKDNCLVCDECGGENECGYDLCSDCEGADTYPWEDEID